MISVVGVTKRRNMNAFAPIVRWKGSAARLIGIFSGVAEGCMQLESQQKIARAATSYLALPANPLAHYIDLHRVVIKVSMRNHDHYRTLIFAPFGRHIS